MSFFGSIFSKNMVLLPGTKKDNILEAFTGISFYNVYEISLRNFCLRRMKIMEMPFRIEEQ